MLLQTRCAPCKPTRESLSHVWYKAGPAVWLNSGPLVFKTVIHRLPFTVHLGTEARPLKLRHAGQGCPGK